jgi:MFS family permease
MRGMRQIAYGMMAVILAITLTGVGLSPTPIGLLVSVSLAGDLFGTLVIGRWADQWGRRRALIALALLMAATGLIFGLAGLFDLMCWYPLLLVVAFFGTLGTSSSETAPFLPIEQAMLGQVGNGQDRTRRFASYNFVAVFAGALGR